ncbi:hypothetical protein LXL04_037858 [Taraxacum kok-saghyz]
MVAEKNEGKMWLCRTRHDPVPDREPEVVIYLDPNRPADSTGPVLPVTGPVPVLARYFELEPVIETLRLRQTAIGASVLVRREGDLSAIDFALLRLLPHSNHCHRLEHPDITSRCCTVHQRKSRELTVAAFSGDREPSQQRQ